MGGKGESGSTTLEWPHASRRPPTGLTLLILSNAAHLAMPYLPS